MKKVILAVMIVFIAFCLNAYDTSYTVKQDGTGDYTEIQAAINAVSNGTSAVIYVYGSFVAYSGANNTDLTWNGNYKTIYMYGVNNPLIDCNDNSRAFNLIYTTTEDIIKGFTIVDASGGTGAGGAIRVKDGCVKILNNTFEDCYYGTYTSSYEMTSAYSSSRGGAIFIEHANDTQSSEISGNSFDNCVAFEGGAICIEEGYCLIEDNDFDDNHSCYSSAGTGDIGTGGAIHTISGSVDAIDNEFSSNSSPGGGIVISGYASTVSNNMFDSNYRGNFEGNPGQTNLVDCGTFSNNIVKNHSEYNGNYYALIFGTNTYRNNTFISNAVELSYSSNNLTYTNCIFKNNSTPCTGSNFIYDEELEYCLIINSESTANATLTNCLTVDPQINSTTYQPIWSSTVKSPCIDAGDPTLEDDDDTPSDIGAVCAITHKYDIVDLPDPALGDDYGIKWLSLPALDVVLNNADIASNALDDVLDPSVLYKVKFQDEEDIYYYENDWLNDTRQLLRWEGYIFLMHESAELDVPGFKLADNTTVTLYDDPIENWIGYWLEETQTLADAFGDEWANGNIYSIKHQDWSAYYSEGTWKYKTQQSGDPALSLSYGDMVKVKCHNTISRFSWDNSTPEDPKAASADPANFTYTEQADYTPIFIEVDVTNPPTEIGAFVDDVCIGATVVEGDMAQINAYTTNTAPGDIELELYYGARSNQQSERIASYKCRNSNDPEQTYTQLNSGDNSDAWFVSFNQESELVPASNHITLSNFPNPFNPTTTISYNLPLEGNISLNIYNTKGQLVKQLVNGTQPEGYYDVVWNGKDAAGKQVSSGIYYYRINACGKTINKKMLMLK
jgi:FlgD Ig-like domain